MNDEMGLLFELSYLGITIDEQVRLINNEQHDDRRPCVCVSLFNPEYDIEKLRNLRSVFTTVVMSSMALCSLMDWAYLQTLLYAIYNSGYKIRVVSLYQSSTYMTEDIELRPNDDYRIRLYTNGSLWLPMDDIQRIPLSERTEPPK